MRLAGQAKAGFYPANPKAIELIAKHLYCRLPSPERKRDTINAIDPCCGEGLAIRQLTQALGIPSHQTYAVELDGGRVEKTRENIPGVNLIGPASFLGTHITPCSFGLAYVNPPFDFEMGGGRREEQAFAEKAARLLTPRGILVLVAPLKAVCGNRNFVQFLDSHFEGLSIYKFPDGKDQHGDLIRPYNEIVVFGRKRPVPIPADALQNHGDLHKMQAHWSGYVTVEKLPPLGAVQPVSFYNGNPSYEREEDIRTWEILPCWKANVFRKVEFTEDELIKVVRDSPLNRHLQEVTIPPPARPPLPLDKGHLGLILASGMLNGAVEGPHGPHVVRGSSKKVEYHNKAASTHEENPDTGAVTSKDVYSQRMVTVIRVVESDGVIRTYSNEAKDIEEEGE